MFVYLCYLNILGQIFLDHGVEYVKLYRFIDEKINASAILSYVPVIYLLNFS